MATTQPWKLDAWQVQPLALARWMADAARQSGAQGHEHTPARLAGGGADGVHLDTPRGLVRAQRVVVCTNAYASDPAALARLRRWLAQELPWLDAPVEFTWGGPFVRNGAELPVLGPSPADERVVLNTGYGGSGVALGCASGRLAAGLVARGPDDDVSRLRATSRVRADTQQRPGRRRPGRRDRPDAGEAQDCTRGVRVEGWGH